MYMKINMFRSCVQSFITIIKYNYVSTYTFHIRFTFQRDRLEIDPVLPQDEGLYICHINEDPVPLVVGCLIFRGQLCNKIMHMYEIYMYMCMCM